MEVNVIIEEVNKIFVEVLDNTDVKINYETTSEDVEEWDSLNHIQLIVAIEKHFNIRFNAAEIVNFSNVGEMCEAIRLKTTK